jgi:hypothetical protein
MLVMLRVLRLGVLGLYIYIYSDLELVLSLISFGLVLPQFLGFLPVVEGVAGVQWDLQQELQWVLGLLRLPFGCAHCAYAWALISYYETNQLTDAVDSQNRP